MLREGCKSTAAISRENLREILGAFFSWICGKQDRKMEARHRGLAVPRARDPTRLIELIDFRRQHRQPQLRSGCYGHRKATARPPPSLMCSRQDK